LPQERQGVPASTRYFGQDLLPIEERSEKKALALLQVKQTICHNFKGKLLSRVNFVRTL